MENTEHLHFFHERTSKCVFLTVILNVALVLKDQIRLVRTHEVLTWRSRLELHVNGLSMSETIASVLLSQLQIMHESLFRCIFSYFYYCTVVSISEIIIA